MGDGRDLPVPDSPAAGVATRAMMASFASQGGSALHVVDTDPAMLCRICLLLQSACIPVVCHASIEGFLHALDESGPGHISCLLTDMNMPGIDAISVLHHLAARGASFPVVVMQAKADVASAVAAMKAGAADFLEKPVTDASLLAVLRSHIRQGAHTMCAPAACQPCADATTCPGLAEDAAARVAALSTREEQVLRLLAHGCSNKAIARDLGLSHRTRGSAPGTPDGPAGCLLAGRRGADCHAGRKRAPSRQGVSKEDVLF